MKKLILVLIALYCFFSFTNLAFASSSNFLTDYNTTYSIDESGIANVMFDVTLTNKTSNFYASSYSITVGFKNIRDVKAFDSKGSIMVKLAKNEEGNKIDLEFLRKIVGIKNKYNFKVTFNTPDIVQKSGQIWDINIPGLAMQNEFNTFNVKVQVPKSLSTPTYIKPDIGMFNNGVLNFSKEELGDSGISISFGTYEIYKFDLAYHLENKNFFPIKTKIALPPTTNYQEVAIDSIDPKPLNVEIDQDGNWMAEYLLFPTEKIKVLVAGRAKLQYLPKKQPESEEKLALYLNEEPYWEISNEKIKKLAKELKTPSEIYNYVVSNLKYDFSRVSQNLERLGASYVLDNPESAVCLEFTDLFIALSRAAGIPAREVNGYAYTQNSKERPISLVKDVLHSWPEYYDKDRQTWVMVDPTWGATTGGVDYFSTLDFDHFAFVKKGIKSTYPIPAGGYKTKSANSKDVKVEFAKNFDNINEVISLEETLKNNYFSYENVSGNINAYNVGQLVSSPKTIKILSTTLTPYEQNFELGPIPPFGMVSLPLKFTASPLTKSENIITITIEKNSLKKVIKISPFIINKWTISGGILTCGTILAIAIIFNKSRNLHFFRKK